METDPKHNTEITKEQTELTEAELNRIFFGSEDYIPPEKIDDSPTEPPRKKKTPNIQRTTKPVNLTRKKIEKSESKDDPIEKKAQDIKKEEPKMAKNQDW